LVFFCSGIHLANLLLGEEKMRQAVLSIAITETLMVMASFAGLPLKSGSIGVGAGFFYKPSLDYWNQKS
jgi:hypothetical protein